MAEEDFSEADLKRVERILHRRHGELKLIRVQGAQKALIVKTTSGDAPEIRLRSGRLGIGRARMTTVLTSGAIGKLKKRALEERN